MAKRRAAEEVERQRALILSTKQEKESALLNKAANIHRIRTIAAAQAQQRKTVTKEEAQKHEVKVSESG